MVLDWVRYIHNWILEPNLSKKTPFGTQNLLEFGKVQKEFQFSVAHTSWVPQSSGPSALAIKAGNLQH